ncbi:hypothetical protein Ancab_014892 [Ancistrocladus abbreviatus]
MFPSAHLHPRQSQIQHFLVHSHLFPRNFSRDSRFSLPIFPRKCRFSSSGSTLLGCTILFTPISPSGRSRNLERKCASEKSFDDFDSEPDTSQAFKQKEDILKILSRSNSFLPHIVLASSCWLLYIRLLSHGLPTGTMHQL